VDWVLFPRPEVTCPFLYHQFEQHRCAWPTSLIVDLGDDGGTFRQAWRVHTESWLTLPGDPRRWPQDVRVDDGAAVITLRNGRPALRVGPGLHTVRGTFLWERLPESLPVPRDTGLVSLRVLGAAVAVPVIDDGGNLWLREERAAGGRRSPAIASRCAFSAVSWTRSRCSSSQGWN
jgi:hypothetical protein